MGSKSFLLVGLLLAVFLTVCSEVVARELAETSPAVKLDNENEADVDGYHGGGYHKGGGYKKCRYRCKGHCCSYEEYVAMGKVTETSPAVKLDNENEVDVDGYHGGGYHKGGGYKKCRYRCKGHCCSYEEYMAMGKVTETSPTVKLDNENEADVDGYHGGGYHKGGGYKKCRYRCKGHCCSYEEYVAMGKVTDAQPQN